MSATEQAGQIGQAMGQQAAEVGQAVGRAVGRKAEDIADGADPGVARTAQTLADSVAEQSPALADYVRGAGQKIDRLATDLREKKVGDLLNSAAEFGRSQPAVLLAGAALVGFALSRLIKAGVAAQPMNSGNTGTGIGNAERQPGNVGMGDGGMVGDVGMGNDGMGNYGPET
jgi:hypothetical protein